LAGLSEGRVREWRKTRLSQGVAAMLLLILLRFLLVFASYLNLLSVAQGSLRFVGVDPRNGEEIKALASDWQVLYLKSKPGIVTEALVNFGTHPTEDELYSAEAFCCVSSGWKYDLKLLAKYFGQLLGLIPLP
jgi:hypothetical protein